MKMNRRGHINGIDIVVSQKLSPIRVPPPGAKLPGKGFSQIGVCTADCDKFGIRRVTQSRCDTLPRNVTTTNQPPFNFFNFVLSAPLCSRCLLGDKTAE